MSPIILIISGKYTIDIRSLANREFLVPRSGLFSERGYEANDYDMTYVGILCI
jgi:hypothetical protein